VFFVFFGVLTLTTFGGFSNLIVAFLFIFGDDFFDNFFGATGTSLCDENVFGTCFLTIFPDLTLTIIFPFFVFLFFFF